jgi:hypothetical protein
MMNWRNAAYEPASNVGVRAAATAAARLGDDPPLAITASAATSATGTSAIRIAAGRLSTMTALIDEDAHWPRYSAGRYARCTTPLS